MDEEMHLWLDRLFGETDKDGANRLMELDEFCPPDNTTFQRLADVFENSSMSLAPYSDHRIAQALWDLISNVFVDLGRTPAAWNLHLRVFNSFEVLFRQFFASRCEPGSRTYERRRFAKYHLLYVVRAELVLHSRLQYSRDAAVVAIDHWRENGKDNTDVEAIIDDFPGRKPNLRPELREYALSARTGMVQ